MIAIKNRTEGFLLPVFEGLVDLALAHDQQSFFAVDALGCEALLPFRPGREVLGVKGGREAAPGRPCRASGVHER